LTQLSLGDEVVDRVHQKQRIAVRVAVEHARQLGGQSVPWKAPIEVFAHGGGAQELERDLVTVAVELQLLLDPSQWVRDGRHVGGTVGAEDQQARGFSSAGQHAEQVDGGGVTPVQVFEQQHKRCVAGQGLESLDQLAERPGPATSAQ